MSLFEPANYSKPNLTKDQEIASTEIIKFISEEFNENKMAVGLIGAGGTGKTFIINYIINNCKLANSVIKCTSPTNKACRVFTDALDGKNVDTIQSTFGFRLDLRLEDFDPNHPQFNPLAPAKLEDIKLLIVDEASMLPAKLTNYILKVCKVNCIKIIFIGDNNQLPPVKEKQSIAFSNCFRIFKLEQIVRQNDDNPVKELLKILRKDIDNKTYNFINYISQNVGASYFTDNGGFAICNSSNFVKQIELKFTDPEYTKNVDKYRIIAYTNATVTAWNNFVRSIIIKDSDKGIITKNDLFMSYNTIVDEFLDTILINSEEYIVDDLVDYVDSTYDFKGYLVKFQAIHGGAITKPLFLINHKDPYSIKEYYRVIKTLEENAKKANIHDRSSYWKAYYDFRKKYLIATNIVNRENRVLHPRDLDYAFAITAHKSQGSTYDTVFVDIQDMIFMPNGHIYTNQDEMLRRLYVACSRCKNKLYLKLS